MVNLSSFIRFHAARSPERIAVVFQDQRISYAELSRRIERTAGYLAAQGIGPDDVVAVMMKNSAAFSSLRLPPVISARCSCRSISASPPTRWNTSPPTPARSSCSPTRSSPRSSPDLPATVLLDERGAGRHHRAFGKISAGADARRKPDDLFRLMYTSGTTDRPKGVIHTYDNFYWKSIDHVIALGLGENDRLLVAGPLYHVGAFDLPGVAVLWVGGHALHSPRFRGRARARLGRREKLTGAWLAPVMLGAILAHPRRAAFDVSSVRWIIGGGERTPEARIRAVRRLFHSRPLHRRLRADRNRAAAIRSWRRAARSRRSARSGARLPTWKSKSATRPERGCRAGEAGEICLRGPKITRGYWRDRDKTAASFHGDWFRTGDVGYLDAEGFLYLTDRVKDMIISGGENIASSEVERVVYQLPQVREAAIIGAARREMGRTARRGGRAQRRAQPRLRDAGKTLPRATSPASRCRSS